MSSMRKRYTWILAGCCERESHLVLLPFSGFLVKQKGVECVGEQPGKNERQGVTK